MSSLTSFISTTVSGDVAVAPSEESTSQSTPMLVDRENSEKPETCDLPHLEATSKTLPPTTEVPSSSADPQFSEEYPRAQSESASNIVMPLGWGMVEVPLEMKADELFQLWSDAQDESHVHAYLTGSAADPTVDESANWESFFVALRDNMLSKMQVTLDVD